ncbi:hypothetical protein CRE_08351 [Caenorhabditis remanei]|uniref:Uncharacterized protein n=1 Tax=Caenorhabditis remanei TaxID=31234 RepID=E3MPK3_CAERE|nr:hypothetical protein CRE_08351 [Caenorhabditis remanei]
MNPKKQQEMYHELERWKSSPQPITYKKCRHQIVATESVGPLAQKNQLAMKCIRGPTPKSWII